MIAIGDLDNPYVLALGVTLYHMLWQGALVGVLCAVALRVLHSHSPQVRYVAACAALLIIAALGAGTFAWVLPARDFSEALSATPLYDPASPLVLTTHPALPTRAEVRAMAAQASASAPAASSSILLAVDRALYVAAPWAACAWSCGALVMALRLLLSMGLLESLRYRGCSPAEARLLAQVEALRERMEVRRFVALRQSARVAVPCVIGIVRPLILLPAGLCAGLTPGQLEAILAHELAHIRRHDFLINLLQSILVTLLFFHPVAWWLNRRINLERELCCDDLVAARGDARVYAEALAAVAALALRGPNLALAATDGALLHRIRRLLALPVHNEEPSRGMAGAFVITLVAALCFAAMPEAPDPAGPKAEAATSLAAGEGRLHVLVIDPAGQPAANATVRLELEQAEGGSSEAFSREVQTDAAGEAQFTELGWGSYFLMAGNEDLAGRDNLRLNPDRTISRVEVVLKPSGPVRGTVVNGEGAPVAGAALTLLDLRLQRDEFPTAVSDSEGRFAFAGIPQGQYIVQSAAAGYAPRLSERASTGGPPVALVLDRGGSISGVVRMASGQDPVPGVRVRVEAGALHEVEFEAVSDAAGRFLIENAPAGPLVLSSADNIHAASPPETPLVVDSGETATVELQVEAAARITGRIHDTNNQPVVGATVQAQSQAYPARFWRSSPTDGDGRYELTGLAPGLIDVMLSGLPRPYPHFSYRYEGEIALHAGELLEGVDFEMARGETLCGTVVNDRGEPVAGAAVKMGKSNSGMADSFQYHQTSSGADGSFCIADMYMSRGENTPEYLTNATIELRAEMRGAVSEPLLILPSEPGKRKIALMLEPYAIGSISGTVVDEAGNTAQASLSLVDASHDSRLNRQQLRTEADGSFLVPNLPASEYEIWMAPDNGSGYTSGKKLAHALTLEEGERVADLRLVLKDVGEITGVLKDGDGAPLPFVKIEAWDLDTRDYASGGTTDREGRFRITFQGGTRFELRPGNDYLGKFYWSLPAKPGDDVDITLTPEMLQGTRPPEPVYIIHPVTGKEVVTTEAELPALTESWRKEAAEKASGAVNAGKELAAGELAR